MRQEMPDEIWLGWNAGWNCAEHKIDGYGTKYVKADLTAPVAAGGEALNWKRQKDTVFAWAAEHGFTPVESEIVDLLSALQQPAAPAVDLESLYKGNRHNETDYNQGWNDCIDHLAAQCMIKGVE